MSYDAPAPGQPTGTNGKATASLVLGILGLVVCPIICSVLAIVFGNQAKGEIVSSGGRQGGQGAAQAGVILGWVSLALTALAIVGWIILVALA